MRIALVVGLVTVVCMMAASQVAFCSEFDADIIVFYEEVCENCKRMDEALEDILGDESGLQVVRYEINAAGVRGKWEELAQAYGVSTNTVPSIFVGDEAIIGAGASQQLALRKAIDRCMLQGCEQLQVNLAPWGMISPDVLSMVGILSVFALLLVLQYSFGS